MDGIVNDFSSRHILIIGSGNAALCAAIAALEKGCDVLVLEKGDIKEWGGNSRYTAGAMRFAYDSNADLLPLLRNPEDKKLAITDFGSYTKERFLGDLEHFNEGVPITELQQYLVDHSLETMQWLGSHNVKFDPIYSRQSFIKDGKYIFWGGLTLEAEGEGNGLVHSELEEFSRLGGRILYNCDVQKINIKDGAITGVDCIIDGEAKSIHGSAVVLACGGFESNEAMRAKYLGPEWAQAKVRGTRHNMGHGLTMALDLGADTNGFFGGCHAVPMDKNMPDYGNLNIPHIERKHYRKISYLFGLMINTDGNRFVDEGADFRNYTYAQFGRAVLEQPNATAWQIFDQKVLHLLYSEYNTHDASFIEADTLEGLVEKMGDMNKKQALNTIQAYNASVKVDITFDPTIKDGRGTVGLSLPKSNWANTLDTPPYKAYPVTGGITFTYGGLKIDTNSKVIDTKGDIIEGLFACGEIVGGVFFYGYPGGSGLTSGAVFGRNAGYSAAEFINSKP
jgi:tricarballylate dehydrogenase